MKQEMHKILKFTFLPGKKRRASVKSLSCSSSLEYINISKTHERRSTRQMVNTNLGFSVGNPLTPGNFIHNVNNVIL